MADTLEKRVFDIEQFIAHLPEDLDDCFAGVDTKLAANATTHAAAVDEKLNEILKRLSPAT